MHDSTNATEPLLELTIIRGEAFLGLGYELGQLHISIQRTQTTSQKPIGGTGIIIAQLFHRLQYLARTLKKTNYDLILMLTLF